MQKLQCLTIATLLTLIAAAPLCHAAPASAESSVLDDGQRAKVDKEELKRKMRQLQLEDGSDSIPDQQSAPDCGTIEIGNTNGTSRGTVNITPRETTVIVTGDVFNTAKCGH